MKEHVTWTAEDLNVELDPQEALDLAHNKIAPLLHGLHPGIIGSALADLTASWVLGHPPECRYEAFARHVELTSELTAVYEDDANALRGKAERALNESNDHQHD